MTGICEAAIRLQAVKWIADIRLNTKISFENKRGKISLITEISSLFLSLKQQIIFSFGLPYPADGVPAAVSSVSPLTAALPEARCLPY